MWGDPSERDSLNVQEKGAVRKLNVSPAGGKGPLNL